MKLLIAVFDFNSLRETQIKAQNIPRSTNNSEWIVKRGKNSRKKVFQFVELKFALSTYASE